MNSKYLLIFLILLLNPSCTKSFKKQQPPKALLQAEICKKYTPEYSQSCSVAELTDSVEGSKGGSGSWQQSNKKWVYNMSTGKEDIAVSFKVSNGVAELDGMAIDGEMVSPQVAYKTIYGIVAKTAVMKGYRTNVQKQNKDAGINSIPSDAR